MLERKQGHIVNMSSDAGRMVCRDDVSDYTCHIDGRYCNQLNVIITNDSSVYI